MRAQSFITPLARFVLGLHAFLILSGGVVRVTGSGLGCPTWPECVGGSLTPMPGQEEGVLRPWIEFGNRLLAVVIGLVALALVVLVIKAKRRDLLPLSAVQIAGVLGQAVLGGITVKTDLHPLAVGSHFVLSIILISAALSLLVRSYAAQIEGPKKFLSLQLHTFLSFAVVIAGVVLTGAGPHAGDSEAPRRLELHVPTLAAVHGFLVIALILLTVFRLYIKLQNGPEDLNKYLYIFFIIALSQGAIGYIQYLQGVPELLVAIHLLGSALVWIAAWRIRLTQFYITPSREQR